jgi:PHD/YefM family antitoxin component YafN of YafNO toxin-antitoxin module
MPISKDRRPKYLVDENGEKQGVLLSMEEYEELLEDLEDLAVAAERRGEETVPHEEVVKELRDDGLL